MNVEQFSEKKEEFLTYLEIEKNLSKHTLKAYKNDLNQLIKFWKKANESKEISVAYALERYLIFMYHKNADKSTIARKVSCLKSFERYLSQDGIKINLKLTRPKIDKKLPVYLT